MNKYNQATTQVIKYLEENQYCSTMVNTTTRCYLRFAQYLSDVGKSYTKKVQTCGLNVLKMN